MLHPSFSALQSTVSGHGDYSRLPTINFPRCLCFGKNICDADHLFFLELSFIDKMDI